MSEYRASTSSLDRAHVAAEKLTDDSTIEDVQEVLALFKQAAWPDGRKLSAGTIAWVVADFLPSWLSAEHESSLETRAEKLREDARRFASDAFKAGHYPNPVGHSVRGCVVCEAARAVRESGLPLDAEGLWPE